MTAPAVTQDLQYDAYGNPIKAKPPTRPALTLATGNQTAGNTTAYANVVPQTPEGAGNLLGKTIQPGPAVDRVGLAQRTWDTSTAASAPAYEASLREAKQGAAGVGQLGSGMLRTRLGDLAMQRAQQMDTERSKLMTDAITGSIGDAYQNIGIAQQQQGFQAGQQAQDFQQGLAAQQAALSSHLGLGQLDVAKQQADTARIGTTGQLGLGQAQLTQQGQQFGQTLDLQKAEAELNRMVATGQLTLAQKDQQLRELTNQQQFGLDRDRLAQQGQQFGLTLAEQQAARNQQGQQFTAGQAQEKAQFDANLELQRADLTQRYGALAADRIIEQKKVENQNKQFGLSLAEQQAGRAQQDKQFGQSDLTTQRGQTIAQQGQQQDYMAKLAQILGITDIGALQGLLGGSLGLAGGGGGGTYAPGGGGTWASGGGATMPDGTPIPGGGGGGGVTTFFNDQKNQLGGASWIDPATGEERHGAASDVPPGTPYYNSSQLVKDANGNFTRTKDATPWNAFQGYTSSMGGSFGSGPGYQEAQGATWDSLGAMTRADPGNVARMRSEAGAVGVSDPQTAYGLSSLSSITGLTPVEMFGQGGAQGMTPQQLKAGERMLGLAINTGQVPLGADKATMAQFVRDAFKNIPPAPGGG